MVTRNRTWFQTWRHQWRRLVSSPPVVWDVGAVTTQVHIGQKLVFRESSCLALSYTVGHSVASGDAAYRLLGNSGSHLSIVFPVDRGCLTEQVLGSRWLGHIRKQLWPRRRWFSGLRSPKGYLVLAESAGLADTQLWKAALEAAGLSAVSPVSGLVGLSWYLNLAVADDPCFVLDMGGSQTQIGILIRGSVLRSKTIGRGGIDLTTAIQTWLLQQYHCQVSWRAAEQLKCQFGSLSAARAGKNKTAIRGKDPYTQLGITATVELSALQTMLAQAHKDLLLFIRQFLASVPAENATKCLENGLWIAGGASQIDGIEQWLSLALGTTVSRVSDPQTATSKGVALWTASQQSAA